MQKIIMARGWTVLGVTVALAIGGCARPATQSTVAPMARGGGPTRLSDGEIAGIVAAANRGEIMQARLAESRATHPLVQQYAEQLGAHHGLATEHQQELLDRVDIAPARSPLSQQLTVQSRRMLSSLENQRGAAFDQAYLAGQVQQHRQTLQMLDETLIPSAQNPRLRGQLEQLRSVIAAHLEQAQQLQSTLLRR